MSQLSSSEENAKTPINVGMQMSSSEKQKTKNSHCMKVLIVEDSALLREALMEILQGCPGLSFEGSASTQDEAISLLQEHPFDMLMVDIELVQGNGFEVIKATQLETYPFPKPLYVVLTNHAHSQYRELAKQLGVNYFFDKSMDFELAIETIEAEAKKFLTH
jgi:DNA-binding NarL/FixJ family response regulator